MGAWKGGSQGGMRPRTIEREARRARRETVRDGEGVSERARDRGKQSANMLQSLDEEFHVEAFPICIERCGSLAAGWPEFDSESVRRFVRGRDGEAMARSVLWLERRPRCSLLQDYLLAKFAP
jgi:hypothetical protein